MAELPDVPISAQQVIDELSTRNANLMMANVRLTCMIAVLVQQRDDALRKWEKAVTGNAVNNDVLAYKK